jgi:hypothetical protein
MLSGDYSKNPIFDRDESIVSSKQSNQDIV